MLDRLATIIAVSSGRLRKFLQVPAAQPRQKYMQLNTKRPKYDAHNSPNLNSKYRACTARVDTLARYVYS